ncbi:MAG: cysteine hydrolase family protein [Candidatus Micrarchaeaceae archaeon]
MHAISLPNSAIERGRLMGLHKPIDPKKTAVIAIDFQRFFIEDGHPMGNPHARDILTNANRINEAVRKSGGMVVLTQHSFAPASDKDPSVETTPVEIEDLALLPGSASYELHPDIVRKDNDVVIVKHQSSPLHPKSGTQLNDMLRARGIQTLIVTGLVTNGCCESTTRDAYQHGYNVVFASDATAAMTDEEHNAALLNLAIYYAQVMTSTKIIAALENSK